MKAQILTARSDPAISHRVPVALEAGNLTSALPLGAHLVSPRRHYLHHGIHVGHGRVIHYAGLSRRVRRGPIEEVSLAHFAHHHEVWMQIHPAVPFDADAIVQRARSRLGEDRYHLLSNNCEHLCTWCLFGEAVSTQCDRWLRAPALTSAWLRRWLTTVLDAPARRLAAWFAQTRTPSGPSMSGPDLGPAVCALLLAFSQPGHAGDPTGPQPLPFDTTGALHQFVDAHRQGITVLTLWQDPHHRLAFGVDRRGVPGLYLTSRTH